MTYTYELTAILIGIISVLITVLIFKTFKVIEKRNDYARRVREILAHTDMGSLPNDWTLEQIAIARIDDLMKLRDQVRDTCVRAEKAERRLQNIPRGGVYKSRN